MKLFQRQISKFSTLSVNTLRVLSAEAITRAKSGHPGIALGAAPIMYALFRNHLNVNPKDPFFFNRDRFILSAGHGSALLYTTMLISRYESINMDDLKNFRQLNSPCPGHPEPHLLPGVDAGTGPLGQGIAMGVGMAIAEAKLAAKFNKYGTFIDHYTYVLFGDGCLEEGIAQEAIALAGRQKLGKLIMLYDSNNIQLDGSVNASTNYNVKKIFQAYGWNYLKVRNGNNTQTVSNAIDKAKNIFNNKPTVIEISTVIGYGSRFQNSNKSHGSPLNEEHIKELRETLNYKVAPFTIHPSVYEDMEIAYKRGVNKQKLFNQALQRLESKNLSLYKEYIKLSTNTFNFELDWYKTMQSKTEIATRSLLSEIWQPVFNNNDTFMVGAADLTASTLITHNKSIPFTPKNRDGQNIYYGVREFAMAAINNGITAHGGCKAITSTFLAFSDYNKSAIRLAAISHVPAINVYSHDTITVGEDGPTHQPIEQIWMLRLIPNHFVFRPANTSECIAAVQHAMTATIAPTTIITSRGVFKQYESSLEEAKTGGYVIQPCNDAHINIIATGSEVAVAIETAELLKAKSINAKIISMPCITLFETQGKNYRDAVLDNKPTVSIEYGCTPPWYQYVDLAIGIDEFGKSGKPADVVDYFNLTPKKIAEQITNWYQNKKEGK